MGAGREALWEALRAQEAPWRSAAGCTVGPEKRHGKRRGMRCGPEKRREKKIARNYFSFSSLNI
jgi:hypothetical protein